MFAVVLRDEYFGIDIANLCYIHRCGREQLRHINMLQR